MAGKRPGTRPHESGDPAAPQSPRRRRRRLSDAEKALWRHVAAQVDPLPGRLADADSPADEEAQTADNLRDSALPQVPRTNRPAITAPSDVTLPPAPKPPQMPVLSHGTAPGVDRRTAERLRRGRMPVDGRLDLHGMTREEARRALGRFLAASQEAGRRCVLVITGKGSRGEGGGVLRGEVPHWLNDAGNRARVLSFSYAARHHGGEGALYVLIKRRRQR